MKKESLSIIVSYIYLEAVWFDIEQSLLVFIEHNFSEWIFSCTISLTCLHVLCSDCQFTNYAGVAEVFNTEVMNY